LLLTLKYINIMIKKSVFAIAMVGCFAVATLFSVNNVEAKILGQECSVSSNCYGDINPDPGTIDIRQTGTVSCTGATCKRGLGYVECDGVRTNC
jgi:hypothetical protein